MVEMHGGTISVASAGVEGEGSIFTVRLPCLLTMESNNDERNHENPSVAGADIRAARSDMILASHSPALGLKFDRPPPHHSLTDHLNSSPHVDRNYSPPFQALSLIDSQVCLHYSIYCIR
jgi:hypothetical protein